jgi:hypothetical protein
MSLTCFSRKPGSHDEYVSNSKATLNEAGTLTKELLRHLSEPDGATSAKKVLPMSPKLQRGLNRTMKLRVGQDSPVNSLNLGPRMKLKEHELNRFAGTIDTMDELIQYAKDTILHAEHSTKVKYSEQKLNERRTELRSKRPPQELYKDTLQDALDREWVALNDSRKALKEIKPSLGQLINELEVLKRTFQQHNSRVKRGVPSVPSLPSGDSAADNRPGSPVVAAGEGAATSAVSPVVAAGEGAATSAQSVVGADQVLKQANSTCIAAQAIVKKADSTILQSNAKCADASAQVISAFGRRAANTAEMRLKIEEQVTDTDAAILEGEKRTFKLRTGLMAAEAATADPSTAAAVLANVDKAEVMLGKLRASRKSLAEDLRCKVASEKVDAGCRLMNPSRTPCHRSGRKQAMDFSRLILSHSAPDLGVSMMSESLSPMSMATHLRSSPAGTSTTLIAAGTFTPKNGEAEI